LKEIHPWLQQALREVIVELALSHHSYHVAFILSHKMAGKSGEGKR
jgi:hypothetical protein